MLGDLPNDVDTIVEPPQLGARRRGEDRRFAIFALITVSNYIFAVVSDARFNVVW